MISVSATDSYDICLADVWSDYKEEIFSWSWETSTDQLPCDFPVFM